jgi:hypothetical protein
LLESLVSEMVMMLTSSSWSSVTVTDIVGKLKKDVYKCSMDGRIINFGWKFYKSTVIYARELPVLLEFISHVSCFCFLFENAYKSLKEIT